MSHNTVTTEEILLGSSIVRELQEQIKKLEERIRVLEQKSNTLDLYGNTVYHIHSWDQRIGGGGGGGGIPSANTTWSGSSGQGGISPTCYNPDIPYIQYGHL